MAVELGRGVAVTEKNTISRCVWCGESALYQSYHDTEWGVPEWDSRALFEKLILDGAQAGLSWITVLRKRDAYREAYFGFDPAKMAGFSDRDIETLMRNPGIIRNRLKILSARQNARAYLEIMSGPESFADFLWKHVDYTPRQNNWRAKGEVPTASAEAEQMSKALKKAGFNFVGPTIVYAFMQAVGMVNDHTVDCFRHAECAALGGR